MNENDDGKMGSAAKPAVGFAVLSARILVAGFCIALLAACDDLGSPLDFDSFKIVYHSEDIIHKSSTLTERLGENHIVHGNDIFNVAGYSLEYWTTGSGGRLEPGDSIEGSATDETTDLYAHWKPNTYTVQYFPNNGIDDIPYDDATVFTYGTLQALKTIAELGFSAPSGDGFIGWARTAGGQPEFRDGQQVPALTAKNGDKASLYARWGSGTVIVTYDTNGGSGTIPGATSGGTIQYNIAGGEKIILPNADTVKRGGYKFVGWNGNAAGTGTNHNVGAAFSTTANATLYANWNPINIAMEPISDTELCAQWYYYDAVSGKGKLAFEFREDGWFHFSNDDSIGYGVVVDQNGPGSLAFFRSQSTATVTGAAYRYDTSNNNLIIENAWGTIANINGTYTK